MWHIFVSAVDHFRIPRFIYNNLWNILNFWMHRRRLRRGQFAFVIHLMHRKSDSSRFSVSLTERLRQYHPVQKFAFCELGFDLRLQWCNGSCFSFSIFEQVRGRRVWISAAEFRDFHLYRLYKTNLEVNMLHHHKLVTRGNGWSGGQLKSLAVLIRSCIK